MNAIEQELSQTSQVLIKQRRELTELLGVETRNKYSIETSEGRQIGFAAEQQKGFVGLLFRQFLGHWRTFDILIFDLNRQPVITAHHPFRFYFSKIEVKLPTGEPLGYVEKKFSILSKKFVIYSKSGQEIGQVSSPIWKIWTFPVKRNGNDVAVISKKWGGLVKEAFIDADSFSLEFKDRNLSPQDRSVLLSAAIFVDLLYFEAKANR